jgi:hypothetical protein
LPLIRLFSLPIAGFSWKVSVHFAVASNSASSYCWGNAPLATPFESATVTAGQGTASASVAAPTCSAKSANPASGTIANFLDIIVFSLPLIYV